MSLESLEEMLKKQFPGGAPVEVPYRRVEPVASPEYPVATPQEMERQFAKARANTEFKGEPKPSSMPYEPAMDVPVQVKAVETSAQTAPQSAPAVSNTDDLLARIRSMSTQSQAPIAPAVDPVSAGIQDEIELMREKSTRSGGEGGVHWAELLGMALPVALGASVGQVGAPARSSGAYGIARAKEERDKANSLDKEIAKLQGRLALARGRAASKGQADPMVTVRGPDNQPYPMRLSQAQQLGLPEYRDDSFTFLKGEVDGEERFIPASTKTGKEAEPGARIAQSDQRNGAGTGGLKAAKTRVDLENAITANYKNEIARVQKSISEYQNVQEAMRSGDPTRQVTGVMGFLRVVDPDSVARESEVAAILGARDRTEAARMLDDILLGRTKLTPRQAAVIANASDSILNNVVTNYESISAKNMEQRARSVGLDTGFVPKFSGRFKRFDAMDVPQESAPRAPQAPVKLVPTGKFNAAGKPMYRVAE